MRTNTNNIYRDKIMSDITEQDVGSNLKIAGWVENIRDHGGVSFIDLRDMYGVMQVARYFFVGRYQQRGLHQCRGRD